MSLENLKKLKRINQAKKLTINDVDLHIRSFSALERAELLDVLEEKYNINIAEVKNSTKDVKVKYKGIWEHMIHSIYLGLADENGNKLFKKQKEAFEEISEFENDVIQKLHDEIMVFNNINEKEEKKEIKN